VGLEYLFAPLVPELLPEWRLPRPRSREPSELSERWPLRLSLGASLLRLLLCGLRL
jgi:hypothetical protein